MQVIKTVLWVLLVAALVLFCYDNWRDVEVRLGSGYVIDTKLPALMAVSFLIGLLPTWLFSAAGRWRLRRRINTLENTVRATTPTPPLATSTQLEAANAAHRQD